MVRAHPTLMLRATALMAVALISPCEGFASNAARRPINPTASFSPSAASSPLVVAAHPRMSLGPVSKAIPLAFAITRARSVAIVAAVLAIAVVLFKKQGGGTTAGDAGDAAAPTAPAAPAVTNMKRQDPQEWTRQVISRIRLEKAASAAEAETAVAAEIYNMSPSTALAFLSGPEPKKAGVSASVLDEAVAVAKKAAEAEAAFSEAMVAAEMYKMNAESALLYLSSDAPALAGVSGKATADAIAALKKAM